MQRIVPNIRYYGECLWLQHLNAVTFMGKNYSTMQNVVQNEDNITLKQMFDITAQTIHNDDEIYCLDKVVYQRNSWTKLSLIDDPVIIGLQSTKVYVFSDSVLCLGKVLQHPESGKAELQEYEPRGTTEILRLSVESLRNSSGIFSQGSHRCSSVTKSTIF